MDKVELSKSTETLKPQGNINFDFVTETFVIERASASKAVNVTTKASGYKTTNTLTVGNPITNSIGFRVTLICIKENTYTVSIESVSNPHALSHAIFDFGSPSDVISYNISRTDGLIDSLTCDPVHSLFPD